MLTLWCGIGGLVYYPRSACESAPPSITLEVFLERCAQVGVTCLKPYISYFHGSAPAAFQLDGVAGLSADFNYYASLGWDPCAALVDGAHRRGILVWAYTAPDYQGALLPNWHSPLGERLPFLFLSQFAANHPEFWERDAEGRTSLARDGYVILDMSHALVRDYLASEFATIVAAAQLDGFELEWLAGAAPGSPYGHDPIARAVFQEVAGRPPTGDADPQWQRYRADHITDFVRALARRLPVGAELSAAVNADTQQSLAWGYDWPAWSQLGITIVLRHPDGDPVSIAAAVNAARMRLQGSPADRLISQLNCWRAEGPRNSRDLLAAARAALAAGADEVGVYRADSVEALDLWPALAAIAELNASTGRTQP